MKSLYIFSGGILSRKDNTLFLESQEGKKFLPIENTRELFIYGEIDLNKRLLEFLTKQGICIHFFNFYGYYIGSYYPREHFNSGHLILQQARHYLDSNLRKDLAHRFVRGSAENILQVLRYYSPQYPELNEQIDLIQCLLDTVEDAPDIHSLMGIEGNIRDYYYSSFHPLISEYGFSFEGRSRRPPKTPLNALISFGNSMMYATILSEIYQTHLDPRIGYLHATNFRHFSLNLDIAEVFKPLIVDRTIFSVIRNREIREEDFVKESQGLLLRETAKKVFVRRYDEHLESTFHYKNIGKVSYRRAIRLELYKIEKHLLGDIKYEPFKSRW
ncbi:MAG TPA: type I-B CRISPR-associated endonuclease Cas1b [Methanolinea sp.]|nr:type I-B CRISPR-associated endonuclease Cas1b [Methanolinea sp.]HQK56083.1 type I-B CRISPR-associated endonuclease Cas1b [Methanolinea sp.]